LAIALLVLGFNFVGDGLRDLTDPSAPDDDHNEVTKNTKDTKTIGQPEMHFVIFVPFVSL
jgi:hypothetical protein